MKIHPGLISNAQELAQICEKLSHEKLIALDTEFIREKTFFPKLEIIQVASKKDSWLIDARYFKKNREEFQPFLDFTQNPKITKVLHAGQSDQEAFYFSFGVTFKNTFDTSLAGSLCGYGDSIGLSNLLKMLLDVKIQKGLARSHWDIRPLSPELEEYAHADVIYLCEVAEALIQQLKSLKRLEWAQDLALFYENPQIYDQLPEDIAEKLYKGGRIESKNFGVLLELVRWREDRVRKLNIPKKWLAEDSALIDLANVKPKSMEQLSNFRGLNKGEIRNQGAEILSRIQAGIQLKLKAPEKLDSFNGKKEDSHTLDLLKCFINILAQKNKIAIKHLISAHQLQSLIHLKSTQKNELAKKTELKPYALDLIGDELIDFLNGKLSLSLSHGNISLNKIQEKKK